MLVLMIVTIPEVKVEVEAEVELELEAEHEVEVILIISHINVITKNILMIIQLVIIHHQIKMMPRMTLT